jgi:anti-sigma factor RsiW
MNHPTANRLQAYLDRDLDPRAGDLVATHVAECRRCAAELAGYERLYGALRLTAVRDPGPALTDRILDRVVPSRVLSRQVALVGWIYTGASAVTTFAFIGWITRPETHVWLRWLGAAAGERVLQTLLFSVNAVSVAALRVREGWGILEAMGAWMRPLARAFTTVTAQPTVGAPLAMALLLTLAVLSWMHASPHRAAQHIRAFILMGV